MRARLSLAFGGAVLLVVGSAIPAAGAEATVTSVTTLAELESALEHCGSIALAADISSPSTALTVSCATSIDLGVHDLAVQTVRIQPDAELIVTGPTDGSEGTLIADATDTSDAGIRTTGATLTVTGGAVHATGGSVGAAIGGAKDGAAGGTLVVAGGRVVATSTSEFAGGVGGAGGLSPETGTAGDGGAVTVTGGSLTATATTGYAVAIGGGTDIDLRAGGGAGADITVSGGRLDASTFAGSSSPTVGGGVGFDEPSGAAGSLTIGAEGTVVLNGADTFESLFGAGRSVFGTPGAAGTVTVDGSLFLASGQLIVPAEASVSVGASGRILGSEVDPMVGATITGDGVIANAGAIALAIPAAMVTGDGLLGSTGTTSITPPPADAPVAVPAPIVSASSPETPVAAAPATALTITAPVLSIEDAGTLAFTVTAVDGSGNAVDASAAVLSSSRATDVFDGRSARFSQPGARTITATLGALTATVVVEVAPAATPTATPIPTQG